MDFILEIRIPDTQVTNFDPTLIPYKNQHISSYEHVIFKIGTVFRFGGGGTIAG